MKAFVISDGDYNIVTVNKDEIIDCITILAGDLNLWNDEECEITIKIKNFSDEQLEAMSKNELF